MTTRWVTELLGTAPATEVVGTTDYEIVDVRDLVDKEGNSSQAVKEKILAGVAHLRNGSKTVVCCDYGISRSNAVAAGIIAVYEEIRLLDAVRIVQEKTGEEEIKIGPLEAVRSAIEEGHIDGDSKSGRTILVTGASGFLGTVVCSRLEKKFEVIAPTRQQLNLELGNTELSMLVAEHNVDCIVHLANPRVFTSNAAVGNTLSMLRNILEVCTAHDVHLVYPSGWEIYSGYAGGLIADEALPAHPRGPYGDAKYLAEMLIRQFQETSDLRCALVRSSAVYGAGGDKPKFLYNFIEKARRSEPIITHRYLNGGAELDLLYVDDYVEAVFNVCTHEYLGALNFGSGIATSIHSVAEMLVSELESNSNLGEVQVESYTARITMNYQKAKRVLNWRPKIMLLEGLRRLL